jgi:DNA-binding MarR family transcriptional regulator
MMSVPRRASVHDFLEGLSRNWPEVAERISPGVLHIYRAQEYLFSDLCASLEPYGLQPAEFDVLAALRVQAPPRQLTPTVLYRSLFLSSGGLTKILGRLESAGLVDRPPNPSDRRSRFVRLTAQGQGVAERAACAVLDHEQGFLAPLTASERETLADLLRRLIAPREP